MSDAEHYILIKLEPYLSQWFVHDAGGEEPVVLRKLSTERRILEVFLQKWPILVPRTEKTADNVAVVIPDSRTKPPQTYNYLPRHALEELKRCIRNRFYIQLWNDLHQFGYIGVRRDQLIFAWMEEHGIELTDTNWNTIAKIYLRLYKNYLKREKYRREKDK